jgi:flagellar assembly protein FliH
MSSKVLVPDRGQEYAPPDWRQVQGEGEGEGEGTPPAEAPVVNVSQADLERECAQKVAEARAAGVREGEAAGRSRAQAELKPVIDRLARSIEEIGGLRARLRKEAEADMVQLSLAVARRVLRREIAVDPEALRGLVMAALERLAAQEIARVRVHPSHAAMVGACLGERAAGSTVEVVADGSREPGTVVFETDRGNLDASVETQLDEIGRGLADVLRRRS